jgi:GT2 family glycosyltransferase
VVDTESPGPDTGDTIRFAHAEHPTASVIITGWRAAPYLTECLASLHALAPTVPYEVIVTLNEPTDALLESLDRQVDGALIASTPVNVGFGGACNRGAAMARGRYLVLLNDDATVLEGWLESLVEAAELSDDVGAVGSRILHEDGTVQEEGAVIWADGATTLLGYMSTPQDPPDLRLRRVDYCSAASLLVRRDTWEALGGMDEGFFPAYYEDVDLSLGIGSKGQKILYQPRSTVIHREGSSTTRRYRAFLAGRNKERIATRWAPGLALHEPPEQDDPEAVARAASLGESRPLARPAPLAPPDDLTTLPDLTDEGYLRQQIDTLNGYTAALEAELTEADTARVALEGTVTELHAELDRMHHAAADLQELVEKLDHVNEVVSAELAAVKERKIYKALDGVTTRAGTIPVIRRFVGPR